MNEASNVFDYIVLGSNILKLVEYGHNQYDYVYYD